MFAIVTSSTVTLLAASVTVALPAVPYGVPSGLVIRIVTVSEVTRSGTPVRTARFMASRILALVEHPAADQNIARDVIEPQPIRTTE